MRLFRYRRGRYVATFSDVEARVLADLADQVRTMLAARRTERPVDPLAALTGMTLGPSTAPEDPAIARLLPDYHHDDADLSAALRILYEPALIASKDAAAVVMLDSMPRGGGTVRLEEGTAQAWLQALNDIRLALGVRLDISQDDEDPPAASAPPDSPEFAMYATYRWLSVVQESLVDALMGES
jgi:hypothetical protein